MPKLSATQLAARRHQILEAAIACFAEQGVDGTSMRDIEARSGISRGGLYVYFETKSELVQAVFDLLREEGEPHVTDGPSAPPTLDAVIERAFAVFRHPDARARLALDAELHAQLLRRPALLESRRADYQAIVAGLAEVVRGEQATGGLPAEVDPALAAGVLLAIQHGTKQAAAFAEPGAFDLDAWLDTVRALLGR